MTVGDLAALLTALAVVVGTAWTAFVGRKQNARADASSLWTEAMDIIDALRKENDDLKDEIWQLKHPGSRPRTPRPRRKATPAEPRK